MTAGFSMKLTRVGSSASHDPGRAHDDELDDAGSVIEDACAILGESGAVRFSVSGIGGRLAKWSGSPIAYEGRAAPSSAGAPPMIFSWRDGLRVARDRGDAASRVGAVDRRREDRLSPTGSQARLGQVPAHHARVGLEPGGGPAG